MGSPEIGSRMGRKGHLISPIQKPAGNSGNFRDSSGALGLEFQMRTVLARPASLVCPVWPNRDSTATGIPEEIAIERVAY